MSVKKTLLSLGALGVISAVAYLSLRKITPANKEKSEELIEAANNVKRAYTRLTENIETLKNELPNSQQTIDDLTELVSEYQFKIQNNLDNISKIQDKNKK
ncbi:MAG: hypothetical protein ABF991_06650 [Liquorilactobacillus hordei]|uniref:Uncharacterized protein n=2 Tax=Liquorilactobacillus hordei TaxID=468911 RepID=A0A0R1MTN3_9LACO|nr:hypothetical protein [Liquorilactobacillus hordei]AUJ30152.1 hypothetical protein BSQ49_07990 [Liquorilactobacillus hordei]KRL07032.1 hypothetical protein FC92_GL000265 [Liquorilactobacillus hordei DSM 19519]QYH52761.1 hypothetical protein G6O70_10110 [Liquorilactobacillus hordei DSM 19519]